MSGRRLKGRNRLPEEQGAGNGFNPRTWDHEGRHLADKAPPNLLSCTVDELEFNFI